MVEGENTPEKLSYDLYKHPVAHTHTIPHPSNKKILFFFFFNLIIRGWGDSLVGKVLLTNPQNPCVNAGHDGISSQS